MKEEKLCCIDCVHFGDDCDFVYYRSCDDYELDPAIKRIKSEAQKSTLSGNEEQLSR